MVADEFYDDEPGSTSPIGGDRPPRLGDVVTFEDMRAYFLLRTRSPFCKLRQRKRWRPCWHPADAGNQGDDRER